MKKVMMCAGILLLVTISVQSQTKTKQSKGQTNNTSSKLKSNPVVSLNSSGEYAAKGLLIPVASRNQLTISDPILKAMDARASGYNTRISNSGIVGMPKTAYGFANGHLTLRTTGSTTSGTQTGSGSVATGTSLGTFGSLGPGLSVNGKSPYAGTIMWGTARNMYLPLNNQYIRGNPSIKKALNTKIPGL
jgi:hypothetical protein